MATTNTLAYESAVWIDVNADYGVRAGAELLLDNAAINGSLRNLLRCQIGSRRMLREYGTYLPYYLQEPLTQITADSILSSLVQSIARWEPRVSVDLASSSVVADTRLPGYKVELYYSILRTDTPGFFQFTVKRL